MPCRSRCDHAVLSPLGRQLLRRFTLTERIESPRAGCPSGRHPRREVRRCGRRAAAGPNAEAPRADAARPFARGFGEGEPRPRGALGTTHALKGGIGTGGPSAPSRAAIARRPAPAGLRRLGNARAFRSGSCARSPLARKAVRDLWKNFHMLPNTGPSTSRSHGTVKNREIFPDMLPKSSNRAPGSSPERPFSARLPRIAVQYRAFFPNPLPKPLRIPAANGKRRQRNARPGRARQRKAPTRRQIEAKGRPSRGERSGRAPLGSKRSPLLRIAPGGGPPVRHRPEDGPSRPATSPQGVRP